MQGQVLEKETTAMDQTQSNEIFEDIEETDKKRKRIKANIGVTIAIILLTILICFKLGSIGFNGFTSWEIDSIELTGENLQIENNTKLNIFGGLNSNENGNKIIAPMSKGTYRFSVKNKSNYDMIYNIKFEDAMDKRINMKYRLKIDNIYIKGNDNKYVTLNELNLENIIVPRDSVNVYTLEWYWENDDENDTKIGTSKEDVYYYFKLQITSNIYKK